MDFQKIDIPFACSRLKIERVGLKFLKSKIVKNNDKIETFDAVDTKDEFPVDISYLKSLDPKDWKDHDHYAILGLQKLRYSASDDDIRKAYRRMVLIHHPDKRKANGEEVKKDDDYFTCITKAYEILGTPKARRSYDSVDPEFDDSLPTQADIDNEFFESFNKYFNLNARWSEKSKVPQFGDENSKREDVEKFYSFWYEFKSWREFSYLDEEDKEKGQDRDERRWIEKENKAARIKLKKEEMCRIRSLVDLAYNNDKRILKFKNEEKEKKLAAKRAKINAVQAQKAEQDRLIKEAQLAKERAEKAEQKRIEQIRIEREQQKKALRKERKFLRDKAKESNYYIKDEKDLLKNMEGIEKLCEAFNVLELQKLNKQIEATGSSAFFAALSSVEKQIENDQKETSKIQNKTDTSSTDVIEIKKCDIWCNDAVQLLIKAVNLFPAGTSQRWEVIASFINQHSTSGINITARDVLNKAKSLQNTDFSKNSLKNQANESAFESFKKSKKDVQTCSDITINNETINNKNTTNGDHENGNETKNNIEKPTKPNKTANPPKIWTKEEQALLEQAIKTYPISTPDRWDRIAECIPNRTKKDCLRRVKELVDMVNSKKEAQQAVK